MFRAEETDEIHFMLDDMKSVLYVGNVAAAALYHPSRRIRNKARNAMNARRQLYLLQSRPQQEPHSEE